MLTVVASMAAWPLGLGPIYGATAIVTGACFLAEAFLLVRRTRKGQPVKPMRLFHWSITYLTILFIAVAVDALSVVNRMSRNDRLLVTLGRSIDGNPWIGQFGRNRFIPMWCMLNLQVIGITKCRRGACRPPECIGCPSWLKVPIRH